MFITFFNDNIYTFGVHNVIRDILKFCLVPNISHFLFRSAQSSIIDNMLNPGASSLDHGCTAHVEIGDDLADLGRPLFHLFALSTCPESLNFLTRRLIVSLLGGVLPGKSVLNFR